MSYLKKIRLIYLFFSLSVFAVFSQQGDYPSIQVSFTSRPVETSDSKMDLRSIINDTLSMEFKLKGYDTQLESAENRESFLRVSEDSGAHYGLECLYRVKGNTLHTDITLLRINGGEKIFSQSLNLMLNLDLDFSLGSTMNEIMASLEKDLLENPLQREKIKDKPVKENKNKEAEKNSIILPGDSSAMVVTEQIPLKPFKFSLGFAPFLTTGEGNKYFPLGALWQIYGEYRFVLPIGYGAIGLHNSVYVFDVEGSIYQVSGSFISLGPEIRLGVEGYSPLGMYLRLSGGGTLFLMNKEESLKFTLIPYASAGLGGDINFSPSLGLFLEGSYTIYFEKTLFVTGFCPTVGIQFKF